jgi:hypothetical protein
MASEKVNLLDCSETWRQMSIGGFAASCATVDKQHGDHLFGNNAAHGEFPRQQHSSL